MSNATLCGLIKEYPIGENTKARAGELVTLANGAIMKAIAINDCDGIHEAIGTPLDQEQAYLQAERAGMEEG